MPDPSCEPPVEKPKYEPEIIPPGARVDGRFDDGFFTRSFTGGGWSAGRIYVRRIGPLGLAGIALGVAAFLALTFLLVAGALVIVVPIVAISALGYVTSALLRGPRRR